MSACPLCHDLPFASGARGKQKVAWYPVSSCSRKLQKHTWCLVIRSRPDVLRRFCCHVTMSPRTPGRRTAPYADPRRPPTSSPTLLLLLCRTIMETSPQPPPNPTTTNPQHSRLPLPAPGPMPACQPPVSTGHIRTPENFAETQRQLTSRPTAALANCFPITFSEKKKKKKPGMRKTSQVHPKKYLDLILTCIYALKLMNYTIQFLKETLLNPQKKP